MDKLYQSKNWLYAKDKQVYIIWKLRWNDWLQNKGIQQTSPKEALD